jgi:hypothetical protein
MKNYIHITAGDSAGFSLKSSFELRSIPMPEIISLNDDLRVGPLSGIDTSTGYLSRREWWERITDLCDERELVESFYGDLEKLDHIKNSAGKNKKICIWYGSCLFDQLMKDRLLHFINPLTNNVFVVPVSDHPVTRINGRHFLPETLVELNPGQIVELDPHLRPITEGEISEAIASWKQTESNNATMRVLNGTIIEIQEESYFDSALLANCKKEFQKSALVVGMTLVDTGFQVSDTILSWRLKELVRQKKLEAKGILRNMRDYEVKSDNYCSLVRI